MNRVELDDETLCMALSQPQGYSLGEYTTSAGVFDLKLVKRETRRSTAPESPRFAEEPSAAEYRAAATERQGLEAKDSNPKDRIGAKKLPMDLLSGTAKIEWCLAQLEGALKYGTWNWRDAGVRLSIYIAAIERHLEKFKNGEDRDQGTMVHHLGSIMAGCAIMLDAIPLDKAIDDRPPMAPTSTRIDAAQLVVIHLQNMYRECHPYNFTIEDSQWAPENDLPSTTRSTTEPQKQRSNAQPETKLAERLRKRAQ